MNVTRQDAETPPETLVDHGTPEIDNDTAMRYIILRSYVGNGAVIKDWYELDEDGYIHRNFQIGTQDRMLVGARFSPETIFHNACLEVEHLRGRPNVDFIDEAQFENYWDGFRDERPFIKRVPNHLRFCYGQCGKDIICWVPDGQSPDEEGEDWARVPGFERLLVRMKDEDAGERIYRSIFLEKTIDWWTVDGEPMGET